ncbi:MAG: ribonuclease R [Zhongshania aliphaticivorans]|jgi:ribonuclease R
MFAKPIIDMELHEKILNLLGTENYVPVRQEAIPAMLKLGTKEAKEASELISKMLEEGKIARLKKDKICLPNDADLVSGKMLFRQNGAATLIPDTHSGKISASTPGYAIAAEDTGVAMHLDQVLARIIRQPKRTHAKKGKQSRSNEDETPKARVIRILKRARETIPGTLKKSRHAHYVIADDPRIVQDILVPEPANCGIKPIPRLNDKVIVKLLDWTQRHLNPEGEIVEVLGRTHEPDTEFKAILYQYNLAPQFPSSVQEQTSKFPNSVLKKDSEGRKDCRNLFTFTIDPDDAKDFDDALSLEELEEGKTRIGIHIADVGAYVKPGTPLDSEAQKRGNSTYLVGTVIPMLPHTLSNGLCSLVEAQDRLTKSCFITFSNQTDIVDVSFANTVICSNKRLTYKQAHAFMTEGDFDSIRKTPLPPKHQTGSTGRPLEEVSDDEMKRLQQAIRKSWKIADTLRKRRWNDGSLDLDMSSVKIYVDEEGYADRIEKEINDESHQLIEEFMLCANEQVARVMKRSNTPSIYRVHDEPEDQKLQELRETMAAFGVSCGNLSKPREMSKLLKTLKTHPQGYTLKLQVLRSLKQAQYRASADGHYGLAKPDYTHFTSPIRRYSDLIVHRILDTYMRKTGVESASDNLAINYSQGNLHSLGEHLSITERNSTEAEREFAKTKLLEFFEREFKKPEKQSFEAIITDLKNHGLFVELCDTLTFGMVHISTLEDDFYILNNDSTALTGRRSKNTYTLGQTIQVQVERVDRFKRQIDFRIIGSTNTPKPGQNRKSKHSSKRNQSKGKNRSYRDPRKK